MDENIVNINEFICEEKYLIWLTQFYDFGVKKLDYLIREFGSAEGVWRATEAELNRLFALTRGNIERISVSRKNFSIDKYTETLRKKQILFIPRDHINYPKALLNIDDPPLGLYVLGRMPDEAYLKIGIIGSRKHTEYGAIMAHRISKELAGQKIIIVSGMARGLDGKAHEGALAASGETMAVLGCGVDRCYPPEHLELYRRIMAHGCIVSEYPPGTKPLPGHFPARNRIISGLCTATVVIEAGSSSGSLITAHMALDQGRDVFALPGNVTSNFSTGTNGLIRDGEAGLITCGKDILQALGIDEKSQKMENIDIKNNLAPGEKLVYDCISLNPVGFDGIINAAGIGLIEAQSIITDLELKKLVTRLPGQRFIRAT